jgi:hypothetical protein
MSEMNLEHYRMNLPPDLQAITGQLCEVARSNMPGMYEFIYHDAAGYSVSKSPFDRICYISRQRAYLNFVFFGMSLPDPSPLLVSEGKRLRHVKIRSMADAKMPAIGKFVATTWKEAPESIAKISAGRKKDKS